MTHSIPVEYTGCPGSRPSSVEFSMKFFLSEAQDEMSSLDKKWLQIHGLVLSHRAALPACWRKDDIKLHVIIV